MSALPAARTTTQEQSDTLSGRRYPLHLRATIIFGSAAGLWALVGLAGWFIYRIVV
jgi:hypothetical protein